LAEVDGSVLAARGQLRALLHPRPVRADEHPGGAGDAAVDLPADERGRAVGGERRAVAERGGARRVVRDELRALLQPAPGRADEHPRRSRATVVVPAADEGGAAVSREGDADAEATGAALVVRDELRGLQPARGGPGEDVGRPDAVAVGADERGRAVGGERHGGAEEADAA